MQVVGAGCLFAVGFRPWDSGVRALRLKRQGFGVDASCGFGM